MFGKTGLTIFTSKMFFTMVFCPSKMTKMHVWPVFGHHHHIQTTMNEYYSQLQIL